MRRILLTAIACAGCILVLAPVLFVVVMILAGPHSSLLPSSVQPGVLVLGWIVFAVAPILVARAVWRRSRPERKMAPPP